jgi:AcrR family transcriptional regulator
MSGDEGKRRYHSPVREEKARGTRRRIHAAAEALFLRDGYSATSMKGIAAEAGVAERTLYLNFPTKAALLNEIIRVAVRGHDRDEPLAAGETFRATVDAPAHQLLREFSRMSAALMARTARVLAVGEAAAAVDPALREFRDRGHTATRSDTREVADALARRGELAPDITPEHAADTLFAVAANETLYLRVVDECGWTETEYAELLERLLAHLVRGERAVT